MSIRAILETIGKQCFYQSNRLFFGHTSQPLQLMDRISNFSITTLQKWGNLQTVKYPSWKGPQGIVNPKAAEIYKEAYAAETRRKIDRIIKNNDQ